MDAPGDQTRCFKNTAEIHASIGWRAKDPEGVIVNHTYVMSLHLNCSWQLRYCTYNIMIPEEMGSKRRFTAVAL